MADKHEMRIPYPVDDVGALLVSERYVAETQGTRDDVVSHRYELVEESEGSIRFITHMTTYKRTKRGKIDKSGTENSKVIYRYDRKARVLHWKHEGMESMRVFVNGTTALFPEGDNTRIERQVDIKVKIPVVGKAIEKLIRREMTKGHVKTEKQINSLLANP